MQTNKQYIEGFSVVTPTNRYDNIRRIIANYDRQRFFQKELIIILNGDPVEITDLVPESSMRQDIHVYYEPSHTSLGSCLNIGYKKARFHYIAKFDDDDYYGPEYLTEAYGVFQDKKCDVVCKSYIFYYLQQYKQLIVIPRRIDGILQVGYGAGATICMSQETFEKVQYSDLKKGVDVDFFRKCGLRGVSVYSSSSRSFLCIRDEELANHTWKITSESLIRKADKRYGVRTVSLEEAYLLVDEEKSH